MDGSLRPANLTALHPAASQGHVGYFSMEIAIEPSMPTYSGGLGVLAGDTMRSAADTALPLAAVTLVHRKGYFRQSLDGHGNQSEEPQSWQPEQRLTEESPRVAVTIEGRSVHLRAWRYDMEGVTGHVIPIYLLDTDLEINDPADRVLTDHLYGGDTNYRLAQEVVLGIGGLRMLEALGYEINVYHLNEGHASLLTVALLEQQLGGRTLAEAQESDYEAVRQQCVFTTHTPVPAGHDRFSMEQAARILGPEAAAAIECFGGCHEGLVNMTYIALRLSRFVNGVAMEHGKVSRAMFPEYDVAAITNGVHAATWTAPAMQAAFDRHLPRWREDNLHLRYAIDIPLQTLAEAHAYSKRTLLAAIEKRTGVKLQEDVFTLGFARRVATYKRGDLLFTNPERLATLARDGGGMQVIFAGKAHPADEPGKQIIRHIFEEAQHLSSGALKILYLADYEWRLGALLTGGVDLWLNNPLRPYEASGTSGMKAALNGVPSLSVLDGWWIEGCIEGVTGWAIENHDTPEAEADSLYTKLETKILPLYYRDRAAWESVMQSAIALNGSFFSTQRMLAQYVNNAYYPQSRVLPVREPVLEGCSSMQ